MAKISLKNALRNLVDAIMESEAGPDIDAGCDGLGPLAEALVALGDYKDTFEATDAIFGDREVEDDV